MFPIAITYAIWIPLEIIFYFTIAYFSKKNNDLGGKKFLAIMVALNLLPLWTFIAPDSKNLVFDGLLYDLIMVLTMTITLVCLGASRTFRTHNWLGIIMVITGLILLRI